VVAQRPTLRVPRRNVADRSGCPSGRPFRRAGRRGARRDRAGRPGVRRRLRALPILRGWRRDAPGSATSSSDTPRDFSMSPLCTGIFLPLIWATVPPKCCSIASSSRFEASCRNATSFGSGETRLSKSVYRFIIEPVMISNGVLPVGSTADFDIVTARRANCCSRKNFDKASSCSVVGLRSSLACSGTSSPPKCAAFIARHGSAMTAAADELLIAHPPNPNTG
jgi:hypothetical protein